MPLVRNLCNVFRAVLIVAIRAVDTRGQCHCRWAYRPAAADFALVCSGIWPQTKGVLIGRGLVDDGSECHYLVLRSENNRIVYAEFNITPGQALPDRGAKLSLVPGRSPEIAVVKHMAPFQGYGPVR